MKVTNISAGPRSVNVKEKGHTDNEPRVRTEIIPPGATFEGDILEDDYFEAQVEERQFVVGDQKKARAEQEKRMSPKEQQAEDERRFGQSAHQVENRQAAEAAGADPGLADPVGSAAGVDADAGERDDTTDASVDKPRRTRPTRAKRAADEEEE